MALPASSHLQTVIMMLTIVIGVNSKLVIAMAAVSNFFDSIWPTMARIITMKATRMLLRWARRKNEAPSIEKDTIAIPASRNVMIGTTAEECLSNATLMRTAARSH